MYLCASRHFDIGLVELRNDVPKEDDDKAVLLEGGVVQSASPKARSSTTSFPIFRFIKDTGYVVCSFQQVLRFLMTEIPLLWTLYL